MLPATFDGHEDDMIHGHGIVDMVSPRCPWQWRDGQLSVVVMVIRLSPR